MTSFTFAFLSFNLEFGALLATILLIRKPIGKYLGPHWRYRLWWVPALYVTLAIIQPWLPQLSVPETYLNTLNVAPLKQTWSSDNQLLPYVVTTWLAVSLLWLLIAAIKQIRFTRTLKAVKHHFDGHTEKPIKVTFSSQFESPGLFGIFSPTILLPHDFQYRFDRQQQELILRHELFHMRRYDNLSNLAALIVFSVCWANPMSYFAWRSFRQDQELSCDYWVLRGSTNAQRFIYGELILTLAKGSSLPLSQCGIGTPVVATKERVMMLTRRFNTKINRVFGPALLAGLSIASVAMAQNNLIEEERFRFVINNMAVLHHSADGPLFAEVNEDTDNSWHLGIWDDENPRRIAIEFKTEQANSGELITTVQIDSYQDYKTRASKTLVYVGDNTDHQITFAPEEISQEPLHLNFSVERYTYSGEQKSHEVLQQERIQMFKEANYRVKRGS